MKKTIFALLVIVTSFVAIHAATPLTPTGQGTKITAVYTLSQDGSVAFTFDQPQYAGMWFHIDPTNSGAKQLQAALFMAWQNQSLITAGNYDKDAFGASHHRLIDVIFH
jgi:hypothetical protein